MSESAPADSNPEGTLQLGVELRDEVGATEVVTRYDPPMGAYYTVVTFENGHQVQGSGKSAAASIENARQAAVVDKSSR